MSAITTLDKSAVLARAREAIDTRTRFVETLFDAATDAAAAHSAVADARDAAATADTVFEKAYRDALAAGWTAAELKAAGLPTPAAPRRSGRRSTPRRSKATTPTVPTPIDTVPSDGAAVDEQATA
ncbi:hypothetical protein HQ325_03095 [Rhodococcus sp. BP-349]|uniref:hypothetical protein n=1 Tax=unclassified Rhodococcus (in: high G+C Gram-positive bacteria) TaxID=192944 RepID=UPI001C9A6613|nr:MULTISPECIES: hypothetical protein [unclassified Rhodococcus (in: high G+C Gram-positive bacteria)]MBY6537650.1 hypothetical protein [Rhodococcus sp. BP-363]MBY6541987.1 hypothetical protein [Rhodococcus sp. BP-369]MBY6561217.1 hypothetical protein [Rhodococcus sp. BP-370]MBY6575509.1 hypothetical protein [Rhodococcus sp. BP-364]MBY6584810.1 hypothetical protein [Rhodococcus sp. BP-358]